MPRRSSLAVLFVSALLVPCLLVAQSAGGHDLTTTFFGVEHTFDHSGIARDRITLRNYFGGHMLYLHEPSLKALSSDIRAFIRGE